MEYYKDTEKFIVNDGDVMNKLEKFGVAVVPNILNDEECDIGYNGMWNYFEYISQNWDIPLKKENTESYREYWKLFPMHSMLIQHWNAGHAQYVWDIRQNEKVVNIFSNKIWNVKNEELLVSFDGVSLHLPPEITKRGWNIGNAWHHSDQSFFRSDFECVQGFITLLDINEGDATLSVLEGSHKYHKEFKQEYDIKKNEDWYKLKKEEYAFYENKGCIEKRLICPKGSLVLWDSRTIHCGVEPLKTRKRQNYRSIVYVCYMPRYLSSEKLIEKKRKAFKELRMTTHWPCKSKLFPKNPRTYGNPMPEITPINRPILTELGMKIAGF
jgi:hypothetical protein